MIGHRAFSLISRRYAREAEHPQASAVPWLSIFTIFLITRLALYLLIGYTVLATTQEQSLHNAILTNLCRFDCNWFKTIAEGGYTTVDSITQPGATNYAFYPLFPILFHGALAAGVAPVAATALVCNLIFFIALVYIYKYVRLIDGNHGVALYTVTLLCTLPQSIVFSVPYSDGLFLLLLVGAMYAMRREQFLVAGICAALLSATRANGVFFIVFACIWIWRRYGWDSVIRPWRMSDAYLPVVFAPLGLFLFWTYCFVSTGDAFAYSSTEFHGWGWRFVEPWTGLITSLRFGGIQMFAAVISIGVFALSIRLFRLGVPEDAVFCIACVLLIWSSQNYGSLFRYWLLSFPVWYALAKSLNGRPLVSALVLALFSIGNGALTCAWTLQSTVGI
jgi:hypothetical protein